MTKEELLQKQAEKIAAKKKSAVRVMSPQAKLTMKLVKKNAVYVPKMKADVSTIKDLIDIVKDGENTLKLISNKFDSPNIISTVQKYFKIKEVFVSTWAVTPIGIQKLKDLNDKGIHCTVLLDKTHSYKWMFESGATKILTDTDFCFTENHSKFILFDLEESLPLNFIGSFNLSNNPRYENIEINRIPQEFEFYRDFVLNVKNGNNDFQKTLF